MISLKSGLLIILLLIPGLAVAQNGQISGQVTDAVSGQPLPGVNVVIQELLTGAATDLDGQYLIPDVAPGEYTLIASFIGFKQFSRAITVTAGGELTENIPLIEDLIGLEEIVVTGQGSGIEKRRLSTTIDVITPKQLEATPSNRLDQILQAQLPGVQVRFSSGQPGTSSMIRSRGPVSANFSTTPVIYVDGVRVDNLNTSSGLSLDTGGAQSSSLPDIPTENIERIEFIKGGAATTLYGSDAANGVLQIFTKKGLPGRSEFSLQTELGIMSGTEDYLRFGRTADVLFEDGLSQTYRLAGNGGSENFTYSFSGSMHDDNGFRLNNENTRYSLRTTLGAKVSEITRYTGSFSFASNVYARDYNANTSFSSFGNLEGGQFGDLDTLSDEDYAVLRDNERLSVNLVDIAGDTKRFQTSQSMEFAPVKNLTARLTLGLDYRFNVEQETETPAFNLQIGNDPTSSDISRVDRRFLGLTLEGILRHQKDVGDFSFISTLGGQIFRNEDDQALLLASNIAQGTKSINNAAEQSAQDFELTVANYGFYGQENIGFKDRYFIEGGLRVDYNSAFGDQIGAVAYPKVGGAYVLSSEPFFENNISKSLISNLKFRANLGFAGNFPTPFQNERTVLAATFDNKIAYTFGQVGDADLKPEKVKTFEIGGDIGLLNDRVSVEVTYYKSVTEDALFTVPFPESAGQASQLTNIGEVENQGWEVNTQFFLLNQRDVDLRFNVSVNTLDNLVTNNGGAPPFSVGGFTFLGQQVDAGKPLGYLEGDRPTFDEMGNFVSAERDAVLGDPLPDVFGNLSLSLTLWNRLRVFALADYQVGAQGIAVDDVLRFFNGSQDDDRFPKAPDGTIPSLTQATFFDLAGVWVEDTDFFKVRLISLGYTIPEKLYKNKLIKRIDVGFKVVNPFNFVKSSFDPEITGDNGLSNRSELTSQNALNLGVFGFGTESPPRQFLFDLKVNF
ncbi:MAG: TonB-dependent receptor [Rhodothermales bacterium]